VVASFDEPFLYGSSGISNEVPGTYDVAIDGHGYMINTVFEFGRRDSFRHSSIPAQRDATDITNQPGEATINPQGLWRSEFNDWSMGSGQLFVDRKDSQPNRFHHSQGVDVFTNKWYASNLPATSQLIADTDHALQVLVVNGYIYKLNSTGVSYSTNGTSYTAVAGLSGVTPVMMATDGNTIYIAAGSSGLYTTTAGATASVSQLVNVAGQNINFVAYCSNVLLVGSGPTMYQITGLTTTWPTALISQAQSTWLWNSACGGNGWIYIGGFAGASGSASESAIFKTQFASDGTTLVAPAVATPLPPGENVYSMFAFVNYILMGTSLGMRFCQTLGLIDPSGQDTGLLKIGPIIPNLQELATKPVRCFTANQRFVYFGWSNYSNSTVKASSPCTGLGWLDISTFTGDQTPAYSSHLMVSGAGEITSMDWWNGAPIFTVQGQGVYSQATTYTSGTIYSGYIGFRIPDQKVLVAYSVDTTSTSGSVTASINQDDENRYPLGTLTGGNTLFGVPQVYGELFESALTLNSISANSAATTIRRATLQAYPAITAGKNIIAALRFYDKVETRQGSTRHVDVYSELEFLENLRYNQTVVQYQEGVYSWSVVVDDIDMVWYQRSTLPTGGFNGVCMVTLKDALSGLIT
jgi:hypothetical protein